MRSVVRKERRGLSVPSAPHEHGLPLDALRLTGMLPALTTAGGPWRHSRESGNPGFWSWKAPTAAPSHTVIPAKAAILASGAGRRQAPPARHTVIPAKAGIQASGAGRRRPPTPRTPSFPRKREPRYLAPAIASCPHATSCTDALLLEGALPQRQSRPRRPVTVATAPTLARKPAPTARHHSSLGRSPR